MKTDPDPTGPAAEPPPVTTELPRRRQVTALLNTTALLATTALITAIEPRLRPTRVTSHRPRSPIEYGFRSSRIHRTVPAAGHRQAATSSSGHRAVEHHRPGDDHRIDHRDRYQAAALSG